MGLCVLLGALVPGPADAARAGTVGHVRVDAPGLATFGQVLPPGHARGGLRVGRLPTQTDVKTRWPDGSIRFAVVTVRAGRAGVQPVRRARPPRKPAWRARVPQATLTLVQDGRSYVAALPSSPTSDRWLDGRLVREWRVVVAPRTSSGESHPFLRTIFDVRTSPHARPRLDVTVENTLNAAGATATRYDAVIAVAGRTAFERRGLTHPYLTRWRVTLQPGPPAGQVTPDLAAANRAGALPRYLRLIDRRLDRVAGREFDILGRGGLDAYMPNHGGRPELGPYPDWTARYLAHRDRRQRRYVLAHGNLAGSWPVHLRELDGRPVSLDRRPGFWLDPRGAGEDGPLGDLEATGPLVPDNAHQPSLAYVPYLLTGDRYYADEMAFWANYVLLSTWPGEVNERGGGEGLLATNETRGIAWGLRNLADAAAYLPDGDPMRAYLAARVRNNLRWADRYAVEHRNPLGAYFDGQSFDDEGTNVWSIPRPWQNNYVGWALDRAAAHGFVGGGRLRDALARFQLRLFTTPGFGQDLAAPYYLAIGRVGDGQVDYHDDLPSVYRATKLRMRERGEEPVPFAGWYGVDARLMLLIARRERWAGAERAYRELWPRLARDPHSEAIPDLALRAGWAIAGPGER